jgi:hypothetical protein
MSAAFQQMLDTCETPFFIQVDEDMLLDPGAFYTLASLMDQAPKNVWLISMLLRDSHLGTNVMGCKIYRTEIAKKYPYTDGLGCEMDQIHRAKKDGYLVSERWELPPIGTHIACYDDRSAFERYYRLSARQKSYAWLDILMQKFKDGEITRQDLYAILGCIYGKHAVDVKERDYLEPPAVFLKLKESL